MQLYSTKRTGSKSQQHRKRSGKPSTVSRKHLINIRAGRACRSSGSTGKNRSPAPEALSGNRSPDTRSRQPPSRPAGNPLFDSSLRENTELFREPETVKQAPEAGRKTKNKTMREGKMQMSHPKAAWWSYVRNILKRYPHNLTEKEKTAIEKAIDVFVNSGNPNKIKMIQLVYFRKKTNLEDIPKWLFISYSTAIKWNGEFFRYVAMYLGLIDRPDKNAVISARKRNKDQFDIAENN